MNVKDCFSSLPFPAYSCTIRSSNTLPHPLNFHWVSGMCSCWTTSYICFSWTREQWLGPTAGEGAVWVEFPKFCCQQVQEAGRSGLPELWTERDEIPKDGYLTWQRTFCLLPCLQRELKEQSGNQWLIFKETQFRAMKATLHLVSTQRRVSCKQYSNSVWLETLFFLFSYLMRKYQSCTACLIVWFLEENTVHCNFQKGFILKIFAYPWSFS